jgi:NH3-dependent NAD+ synthetase
MAAALPHLEMLAKALPMEDAVRLELREGVPVFRAQLRIQERIDELLEKQPTSSLTESEERELLQYEELDEFLSLVNRLVRNSMRVGGEARIGQAP